MSEAVSPRNPWSVFLIFLRLGLTSFGGPVAHLAYFRTEFVAQRRWLSERDYADLVALCQFLPGPASSQVGMAIGLQRSGYAGALAAWAGFTLPSAAALILFAAGVTQFGDAVPSAMLDGLKIAAVAVVAQAVWGMARQLCPDVARLSIMTVVACFILLAPHSWAQITAIVIGALIGLIGFRGLDQPHGDTVPAPQHQGRAGFWLALFWLALFLVLLIGLPLLAAAAPSESLAVFDAFYRAGSLVFGGGHVVLPLLQAEVVEPGWVSSETLMAGYGAVQAVPGPLFTFAAFLGASMDGPLSGWYGGIIALFAIFIPSFLLVAGTLPFWERLRRSRRTRAALMGINAAVVGLLLAALYDPVWTSAIHTPRDFALALLALTALTFWKLPPWAVVVGASVAAWLLASLGG